MGNTLPGRLVELMRWVAPIAAALLLRAGAAVCGSLVPGTASQFELPVGGVERHSLVLDAGAFVHVELRELGPRVVLALLDPAGAIVARREASGEQVMSYRLLAVAPAGGNYTLEVRAFGQDGPGRHELRLEAPRAATDMDLRLAAADAALAEAARLASEGTPESRRQALARLAAAETGFRDADDRRGVAFAVRDRGIVQFALGDPAAAASFEQALGLFRALGDRAGEAVALGGVAQVRNREGDKGSARALFEQAAALAEAAGDSRATANNLISVGQVLDHSGLSEQALEFHLRGLAVAQTAGSRRAEARAYNNMGVGYQNLGEQRKALECYERALSLMRAAGSRLGEVVALGNISNVHYALDDYDQALAYFEKALPLSQAWALPEEEAYLLKNVSKVHRRLGDHGRAIEAGRRAVDLSRETGEREGEGEALHMLGRALHAGGENDAALEQLRQALTVVNAIGERYAEAETLLTLAQVERDRGHLREAIAYAEACISLTEDLRGAMTNPELRGSFQAAEEDKYGVYIDLLMRMHEQQPAGGHDAAALQVSERARGRLLLEALIEARADIRQGVDADLLDRERVLQKQLRESASRITELPAGAGASDPARRELDALTEQYGQLQSRIRARSPGYAALTQPVPATVEEIRREVLDEDTILLEFYLGEKRSFLWAVTPKDLVTQPLPPRVEIEAAARKVHELETARQRSRLPADVIDADKGLATESVALSRLVLGGIAPRLGSDWKGKRLLIVASGALAYLPFGALPTPGDTSRALLRDHELVYAPSASVLVALRQEHAAPSASTKRVAILADPVFDASDPRVHGRLGVVKASLSTGLTRAAESFGRAGFTRLPFSRQEAEGIASLVGRSRLVKATDFQARRSLVTEGGLADRQILHFATHGLLDSQHPDLSGLVLSLVDEKGSPQDGFLRMHEIYNLRLPADLVVLSACQTALGREIRGEGLVGLTRGFMYAGARSVVASLWQVDDESTAELMKRFYRAMLKDGRRPADALRIAQLELSRDRRWSAPFYWAGFVLQGEWR